MTREDLAPAPDQKRLAVEVIRGAASAEAAAVAALRPAISRERQAAHAHHQSRRAADDAVAEAAPHRLGQVRAQNLRLRPAGVNLQRPDIDDDIADPVEILSQGRTGPGEETERGREAGGAHAWQAPHSTATTS